MTNEKDEMFMVKYQSYRTVLGFCAWLYGPYFRARIDNIDLGLVTRPSECQSIWKEMVARTGPGYDISHVMAFWSAIRRSNMNDHDKLTVEVITLMLNWRHFPATIHLLLYIWIQLKPKPWLVVYWMLGRENGQKRKETFL